MSQCLCECLSTVWMQLMHRVRSPQASFESVLDNLTTRLVHVELQERRCVSEARRLHANGSRVLFRAKMLERRRLQAQLLQLQRYKENVHARMDALSHHAINQTFMQAMAVNKTLLSKEEIDATISDIHESVNNAREVTELLGQPIEAGIEEVTDEDLEEEFMESLRTSEAVETTPPSYATLPQPAAVAAAVAPPPVIRQLVLPAAMA